MAKITTHILDVARGKPAVGVDVRLEKSDAAGSFTLVRASATDDDGRAKTLTDPDGVGAGTYRLTFDTGGYYARLATDTFYPYAQVIFVVPLAAPGASQHFHVPLLLSPFGYSTYRGS